MPVRERAPIWAPRLDLGLRACAPAWKELLSLDRLGPDAVQGLQLAALTLPLSLLLASLAGAPASAGILSAAVGSLCCVFLGGTRTALAGPGLIGALVASGVAAKHGFAGLGVALAIAGVLQLLTGAMGLGRYARLLPLAVLRACVMGTGLALLLWHLTATIESGATLAGASTEGLAMAGFAAVLGLVGVVVPRFPGALLAVVLSVPVAQLLGLQLATLQESATFPIPHVPELGDQGIAALLKSALSLWGALTLTTIVNTAALEQLQVDAGQTGRTDPDQELIGNGLATLALGFLNGLPSTQLVARSAIGVRMAVTSRRPSLFQAFIVLGAGFAAWPFLGMIPLAALTGVAVAVAVPLLDPRPLKALRHVSTAEAVIALATMATLVFAGMETGLFVGLALAFAAAAVRMARTRALLHRSKDLASPHQVTFSGPLTFLAALELERLGAGLARLQPEPGLVMDLRSVVTLDGTAAMSLVRSTDAWRARGGRVALLGPSQAVRERLEWADEAPRPLPPGALALGALKHAVASNDRAAEAILGTTGAKLARPKLLAGLARFREEKRDHYEGLFSQLADGQNPHTLFITCADSRIDPGLLMGSHPGDLFIIRAIGALVPRSGMARMPQEGAAIEYAVGVLGVRTIVVCGHSKCGAISALRTGGIPQPLTTLQSWADGAHEVCGEVASFPDTDAATRAVIVRQLQNLMTYPLVREQFLRGELQINGWFYDLGAVELTEWSAEHGRFVELDSDPESEPEPDAAIQDGPLPNGA